MSGLIQAGRMNADYHAANGDGDAGPQQRRRHHDWTVIAESLPAEWLPASTREAYQAQQRLAAYIDGVFRIRYRARPQPETQRIVFEGRTYDIKPAIELGVREGWDIPAVARAEGA